MTDPFLSVIDDLRRQIAERQPAIDALERIVGVKTLSTSPAPNALPAPPTPQETAPDRARPQKAAMDAKPAKGRAIDVEQLRAMHARGLNDLTIAQELGRSQAGVSAALRRLGLPPNKTIRTISVAASSVERVNAAATIVRWLKERGTIIAEVDAGKTWKVNGRDVIDRAGLLTMANRKRELAKLPPFAWENGG